MNEIIESIPAPYAAACKHPLKVHVWAGISKRGASKVLKFGGIMDADFYIEEIIEKTLVPFVREKFADSHR